MTSAVRTSDGPPVAETLREFERVLANLEEARAFAKSMHQSRVFGLALKLMQSDEGIEALYRYVPRFDTAGLFAGGDWAYPQILEPALVRTTLTSQGMYPALECLSELRFLAIACGDITHPEVSTDDARAFLEDVIARNLDFLFPEATEVTRERGGLMAERIQRLFAFIVERIGTQGIITALVDECERVMLQRPIIVQRVEAMLRTAAHALPPEPEPGREEDYEHALLMIDALEGPTALARENPDPQDYRNALDDLDARSLTREAETFGGSMDRTGLVSRAHATLLRYIAEMHPRLLPEVLALDRIGRTSLAEHEHLIRAIIHFAVLPETARCIYGLSRMLNRGILFFQPVAPGLQRLMVIPIDPAVAEQLQTASQLADPPNANVLLLAGTLSVIGQPRGVDQGHNPTCQAARAISLWSQNDVGYLLELIARAARDNDVVMHFEGEAIRSSELTFGLAQELHTELDAVSLVLTPHLDKIYMEMSRRTIGRGEDGHKWVNPEFHGWWVYRSFASLVDSETGAIRDFDGFVRRFYAAYHPQYNGGRDLVYAQPCGVVSTDGLGGFVGWHAVSIQRVAPDPQGVWRIYFFNPNRDKGQNWGQGIETSTCDAGEWEGESSLPFEQFVMRLYVFHYKRRELGEPDAVPEAVVAEIRAAVAESWAEDRDWDDTEQTPDA